MGSSFSCGWTQDRCNPSRTARGRPGRPFQGRYRSDSHAIHGSGLGGDGDQPAAEQWEPELARDLIALPQLTLEHAPLQKVKALPLDESKRRLDRQLEAPAACLRAKGPDPTV